MKQVRQIFSMLFSVILTLVPLTVSAMPASNVPTRSIFDRQVCYGCIESSACTGTVDVNNLAMTNNPDVANVFSMWIDMFGNDGYVSICPSQLISEYILTYLEHRSMANNGDVYDKGLCCGGWCIIMENTAAYDIDYTCDQISAIDFTSQGGCSSISLPILSI